MIARWNHPWGVRCFLGCLASKGLPWRQSGTGATLRLVLLGFSLNESLGWEPLTPCASVPVQSPWVCELGTLEPYWPLKYYGHPYSSARPCLAVWVLVSLVWSHVSRNLLSSCALFSFDLNLEAAHQVQSVTPVLSELQCLIPELQRACFWRIVDCV